LADKPEPKPSKSAPPPAQYRTPVHEWWSAISPGDLGLKVGYWAGKDADPLIFKPIVGWVTVLSRKMPSEDPPNNIFCPIVLSDRMFPALPTAVPNYCGVFLKDMSEEDAKKRAEEWMNRGSGELQPNMGYGQA